MPSDLHISCRWNLVSLDALSFGVCLVDACLLQPGRQGRACLPALRDTAGPF